MRKDCYEEGYALLVTVNQSVVLVDQEPITLRRFRVRRWGKGVGGEERGGIDERKKRGIYEKGIPPPFSG